MFLSKVLTSNISDINRNINVSGLVSSSTALDYENVAEYSDVQLFIGEPTSEDYVEFTGFDKYTFDWSSTAGTIFGGSLDVTKGLLTVTHGYTTVGTGEGQYQLGSQITAYTTKYAYAVVGLGNLVKPIPSNQVSECVCSVLAPVSRNNASADGGICQYHASDGNYVRLVFPREAAYATKEDVYTTFTDNPIQIGYPLKNPVTYQLTPQQVTMLRGFNNLFSSAGDVTVVYTANA